MIGFDTRHEHQIWKDELAGRKRGFFRTDQLLLVLLAAVVVLGWLVSLLGRGL